MLLPFGEITGQGEVRFVLCSVKATEADLLLYSSASTLTSRLSVFPTSPTVP
jgi:hypothetical protein